MDYVIAFAILQGSTLLIVLNSKKFSDKRSKRLLSILLLFTVLILIGRLGYQPEYLKKYWAIISLPDALLFLFGPYVYFFIRSVLKLPVPSLKHKILHFAPALVHLFVVNTITALIIAKKLEGLNGHHLRIIYLWIEALGIISCGAYTLITFNIFRKNTAIYSNNLSSQSIPRFLKQFLVLSMILTFIWAISFGAKLLGWYAYMNWSIYNAFWLAISFCIYILAFQSMANPTILMSLFVTEKDKKPNKKDPDALKEQVSQLHQTMIEEGLFLQSEITLSDLAQSTSLKKHELSTIINEGFEQNFFDFINSYRVKEFIRLYDIALLTDEKVTFIEVAYQVGFNSKSGFYRAFKKETATNPGDFFKITQEKRPI